VPGDDTTVPQNSTHVYFIVGAVGWPGNFLGEGVCVSSAESAPEPEGAALRKGERTRLRILQTARRVFAEVGYERATIRGIAAAAGVDKSSVIQYFGTKEQLFRDAVTWTIPVADVIAADGANKVENLARGMLEAWAANPDSPMAVLLRTSMTSDEAAEILRRRVTDQAISGLAREIDAPDARLRAALFNASLMGIASLRYLLQMPDLAEADLEDILRIMIPLLEELVSPAD
jgi:AcrR family transcriptional regulator